MLARICDVQTRDRETAMQQRKMNKSAFSVLALCVSALALLLTNAAGQNNQTNDKVKVLSPGRAGSEIADFRCDQRPDYKVYAHAAGSSDAWPKP